MGGGGGGGGGGSCNNVYRITSKWGPEILNDNEYLRFHNNAFSLSDQFSLLV